MSQLQKNRKLFDALTKFDTPVMNALFTTYNFDAQYFEDHLLPEIFAIRNDDDEDKRAVYIDLSQKLKQTDILVFADGKINIKTKISLFGYHFIPVLESTLHAKIYILEFEEAFRLVIASANLTRRGIHNNREVYTEIDLDAKSTDWHIFNDAILFLQELSRANANRGLDLLNRWQRKAAKLSSRVQNDEIITSQFLGVSPQSGALSIRGTLNSFLARHDRASTAEKRVDKFMILSPFFEDDVGKKAYEKSLLFRTYMELKGEHPIYPYIYLYLPTENSNIVLPFPKESYSQCCDEIGDKFIVFENPQTTAVEKTNQTRFTHGKLYAVTNHSHFTLVIMGSSNFSPSGFGQREKGKNNWEANIAVYFNSYQRDLVQSLFPKNKEIAEEIWQHADLSAAMDDQNPDETDDVEVVLVEALLRNNRLFIKSIHSAPQSFNYSVNSEKLNLTWLDGSSEISFGTLEGISVTVRDQTGLLIQDIPIYFSDDSYDPLKFEIPKKELVEWIEARYLNGKDIPLSALLESLSLKSGTAKGSIDPSLINTDNFMMYRIKLYNNLLANILKTIEGLSGYPKRIEYHLIGQYGLVHCVEDYLASGQAEKSLEVFYLYQSIELITSVIAALRDSELIETRAVLTTFWIRTKLMLDAFSPTDSVTKQTLEYQKAVATLADTVGLS
jgi:HKD family nuclease